MILIRKLKFFDLLQLELLQTFKSIQIYSMILIRKLEFVFKQFWKGILERFRNVTKFVKLLQNVTKRKKNPDKSPDSVI